MATFEEGVKRVDPRQQVGRLSQLWIEFGKWHERLGQLAAARAVFQRAVQAHFARVDELAQCWCDWVELELRHGYALLGIKIKKIIKKYAKSEFIYFF
jgi:pre-mRNA-splicing factor SYF1